MQKNLILFDYDDTFLPSSILTEYAKQNDLDVYNLDLDPYYKTLIAQIDMAVCHLLSTAIKLGTVIILTNAGLEWVKITSKHYLPNTAKFLSVLEVVSANERYSNKTNNISLWKYYSMCDILNSCNYKLNTLISIGDSNLERMAAGRISNQITNYSIKDRKLNFDPNVVCSLKFYDNPNLNDLISQLVYTCRLLPILVTRNRYTDLRLQK